MAASPANLEIYRTDSYKSETATTLARTLGNFCPVKIFSLGRQANVAPARDGKKKRKKGKERTKAAPSEIEMSTRCGQDVEKSTDGSLPRRDLWIIVRAFEIYRTNRMRNRRKEISAEEKKIRNRALGGRSFNEEGIERSRIEAFRVLFSRRFAEAIRGYVM